MKEGFVFTAVVCHPITFTSRWAFAEMLGLLGENALTYGAP